MAIWRQRSGVAAILGLATVAAAACGSSSASKGSSATTTPAGSGPATTAAPSPLQLTIGFPDDFTGANAFAGLEQKEAAQLAVTDAAKLYPTVHVSLKTADTQSSATVGVSAVQSLLSDSSINAFAGIAFTQTAQATMPLFAKDGRPTVFLQVTTLAGRGPNVFSMSPPPTGEQQTVVTQGLVPANVKTLGFIYQDQPTLNGDLSALQTAAKAANISVVSTQGTTLTATDFSSQITAVMAKNPDAIGILAIPPATGTIVTQLRQQGYKGILFGQEGDASSAFTKVAGSAANGFILGTRWNSATASGLGQQFVTEFEQAYPSAGVPDQFGEAAYDAVMVLTQAATKAHSVSSAALVQAITSGSFNSVVSPNLTFGTNGFANVQGVVIKFDAQGKSVPLG